MFFSKGMSDSQARGADAGGDARGGDRESLTTQDYLRELLLEQTELRDEDITLFRGNNDSPRARAALDAWREANGHGSRAPSASVAVRLALIDEFRQRSTVLISSEAGAKGLNLQFCDTVINYDLPWNPQRIEQRIGRCHRYGQTRDVTVINFLVRDNQAQRLTFDILSTKLDLFGDVLDMSDVVLQTPRSDASQELVSPPSTRNSSGCSPRTWTRPRCPGAPTSATDDGSSTSVHPHACRRPSPGACRWLSAARPATAWTRSTSRTR